MVDRVPRYWGVDALRMLALIASRGGVTTDLMAAELGLSRSTIKRYLSASRQAFGVVTSWNQQGFEGGGEYAIEDWGVLDGRKVLALHHPDKWCKGG